MKLHINEMTGDKGNAFSSSKRLLHAINFNESTITASSANAKDRIQYELPADKKGGIIVFSEEVNDVRSASDKIEKDNRRIVWKVGKSLKGRYTDKNGVCYGENSLSVEIIGADSDTLIKTAGQLCEDFRQKSVLIKDYSNNSILFVDAE